MNEHWATEKFHLQRIDRETNESTQSDITKYTYIPPNNHHPIALGPESNAILIEYLGQKPEFSFKPKSHISFLPFYL